MNVHVSVSEQDKGIYSSNYSLDLVYHTKKMYILTWESFNNTIKIRTFLL